MLVNMKLKELLRYRNIWIGCAMMWIMLAHSGFDFSSKLFGYLKMWGYGGVDICLFASGIGCYFSLEKDSDGLRFLKRRVIRLAPAYLCFLPLWMAYRIAVSNLPLQAALGNVLGVQSFTGLGNSFSWYISALLLIYLLAPYLKSLADRVNGMRRQLLVVGVLIVLSIPFWGVHNLIITVTRLPVFYIGMLLAKACRQDKQLEKRDLVVCLFLLLAGIGFLCGAYRFFPDQLWSHGLHWYPFLFITPGLCVLISLAFSALERVKWFGWISNLINLIGKNSFELYLVHVFLYEELIPELGISDISGNQNLFWLGTIPVVVLGCWILKFAAGAVGKATAK